MNQTIASTAREEMSLMGSITELEKVVSRLQELVYGPVPQGGNMAEPSGSNRITVARNRIIEVMTSINGVNSSLELL